MAKKGDYFGLGGVVTRFTEGKIVAALIRLLFGFNIIWVCDLVCMILNKRILRLLNV